MNEWIRLLNEALAHAEFIYKIGLATENYGIISPRGKENIIKSTKRCISILEECLTGMNLKNAVMEKHLHLAQLDIISLLEILRFPIVSGISDLALDIIEHIAEVIAFINKNEEEGNVSR
jgi:hypothetical protein